MNTSTESKMTDLGRTLIKMREWLSDPRHWTQGELYKDKRGRMIGSVDHLQKGAAVSCTCFLGAYDYTNGFLWARSIATNEPISPRSRRGRSSVTFSSASASRSTGRTIATNEPISPEAKRDRQDFFWLMNYYTEEQPRAHNRFSPITDWNDTPGRTHAEVLELLDHAIEQERLEAEAAQ